MNYGKTIIFILACVFLLSSVISGSYAATNTNNDSTVKQVSVNQQFQISLTSNPSTGYNWKVSYDPKYLKLVNQKYVSPTNNRNICGAAGTQTYTFKTIKPGQTNITFNYMRPWIGKSVQTIQYKIIINKHWK